LEAIPKNGQEYEMPILQPQNPGDLKQKVWLLGVHELGQQV